jgi:hypothetical protein
VRATAGKLRVIREMKSNANCFEMWWPGTELNRRRQPFQGCALPPELPGHFLSAQPAAQLVRKTTHGQFNRAAFPRRTCAFTGQDAAKQNSRCAGTVRNSRIITIPCPSFKIIARHLRRDFSGVLLAFLFESLAPSATHTFTTTTREGRSPGRS